MSLTVTSTMTMTISSQRLLSLSNSLVTSKRFVSKNAIGKKAARRLAAQQRDAESSRFDKTSRRLLNPHSLDSIGPAQKFRHFVVLDFEATCDHRANAPFGPPEIIEFPALKVCARTFNVESSFHTFVRPTLNPVLKPFCTQLTGIVQDDVDDAPTLSETLKDFHDWMLEERLVAERQSNEEKWKHLHDNFAVVTCGDWDLGKMLPGECERLNLPLPSYFRSWINLKTSFSNSHGKWARGMQHMLDELNVPLHGRPHSGKDDCVNIKNILAAIAHQRKFVFQLTSTFKDNVQDADISKNLESFGN